MILLICCKMKEKGEKERKKGSNVLLGDVFPRGEQREKRKKEKEEPILKIHVIMDIMWRGKLGIERRGVDDYTALLDERVGQNIKALVHYILLGTCSECCNILARHLSRGPTHMRPAYYYNRQCKHS